MKKPSRENIQNLNQQPAFHHHQPVYGRNQQNQQFKPETPQFSSEKDLSAAGAGKERFSYMNFGNITINYRPTDPPKQPVYSHDIPEIHNALSKFKTPSDTETMNSPLKKGSVNNNRSVPVLNSLFYSAPYAHGNENPNKLGQNRNTSEKS